jgi:hypothetical protein
MFSPETKTTIGDLKYIQHAYVANAAGCFCCFDGRNYDKRFHTSDYPIKRAVHTLRPFRKLFQIHPNWFFILLLSYCFIFALPHCSNVMALLPPFLLHCIISHSPNALLFHCLSFPRPTAHPPLACCLFVWLPHQPSLTSPMLHCFTAPYDSQSHGSTAHSLTAPLPRCPMPIPYILTATLPRSLPTLLLHSSTIQPLTTPLPHCIIVPMPHCLTVQQPQWPTASMSHSLNVPRPLCSTASLPQYPAASMAHSLTAPHLHCPIAKLQ